MRDYLAACETCGKKFKKGDHLITYEKSSYLSPLEDHVSCPKCFDRDREEGTFVDGSTHPHAEKDIWDSMKQTRITGVKYLKFVPLDDHKFR